jgi:hypothetical protein
MVKLRAVRAKPRLGAENLFLPDLRGWHVRHRESARQTNKIPSQFVKVLYGS